MADVFEFLINTIRPLLGGLEVRNDPDGQTLTFIRQKDEKSLTYAELAEQIERAINGS